MRHSCPPGDREHLRSVVTFLQELGFRRFQDGLFFVLFVLFHLDLLLLRQTSSTILSNTKVETVFYIASLLAFINVKPL